MIRRAKNDAGRPSRKRRQASWHTVRFLFPRTVTDRTTGKRYRVWLSAIKRRRDPGCDWQYRVPTPSKDI